MARVALLFDLDGTLVDSAPDIALALSAVRTERGGRAINAEDVRPLVSKGAEVLVRMGLGEHAHNEAEDLAVFRTILRQLPPNPSAVFPRVRQVLEDLSKRHVMAIVSNKPEGLSRMLLQGLNLAHYFAAIVGGDTTPFSKPDPTPVHHALAQIGAEADDAIFIGDSEVDAGAARACAMPFVLYTGGYGAAACTQTDISRHFADFGALPGIVHELEAEYGARGLR